MALEGHRVPPARSKASGAKAQGQGRNAVWNAPATAPDEVWSYDFVSARTRSGAPIRILNVVDEYTRVSRGAAWLLASGPVRSRCSLPSCSKPQSPSGSAQTTAGSSSRLHSSAGSLPGRQGMFIEKGRPQQNAYVERFNGTMRDEVLNGEEFANVIEARVVLGRFIEEYNQRRPHRGLGMKTPMEFADACRKGSG